MSWVDDLCRLLDEAGVTVTISAHCRSGVIGDLCRCWRCRGEDGPADDESAAERDAEIVRRTEAWRARLEQLRGAISKGDP